MLRRGMFFATDEHGLFSPAAQHECARIDMNESVNFREFSAITKTWMIKKTFMSIHAYSCSAAGEKNKGILCMVLYKQQKKAKA